MSLTDIKIKNQGFTIVELLIVVVVIAILAAITIVSYNGITTKANASAAKETANNVIKKVELYNADKGSYPASVSDLTADSNASWYISSDSFTPNSGNTSNDGSTAPSSDNGKTKVQFAKCPASGTQTGVKITYYKYQTTDSGVITAGTGC